MQFTFLFDDICDKLIPSCCEYMEDGYINNKKQFTRWQFNVEIGKLQHKKSTAYFCEGKEHLVIKLWIEIIIVVV